MKKSVVHFNKLSMAYCVAIAAILGALIALLSAYIEPQTIRAILLGYLVALSSLAVFIYLILRMPYCVTEYDDRLVEKYVTGEATTVLFKDIERIEYPYFREKGQDNTRSIRFVMKEGDDVLMYDSYCSMKKFLKRWQAISAGLGQVQAPEAANAYRPGAADFVVKPRLAAYPGFYLMWGAAALFLMAVARIVAAPGSALGYVVLPIAVLWYHSQGLPLNGFRKEGDRLMVGDPWLLRNAVYFELAEVGYIAVQDLFVTIKQKDGTVFCYVHKLSQGQKEEFRKRISEMGLGDDSEP